jgi:hypothetical protein
MKKVIYVAALIALVFIASALIPMNTSKENCVEVSGVVKSVSEAGVKDLVFELENDKIRYYINRGLENGFELQKVKADYLGKKAVINYVDSWTILAPLGTTSKHIAQISINGKEIYSEWN